MKLKTALLLSAFIATPAMAQVQTVAQSNIPLGNIFAPHTPSGFFSLRNDIWFGDESQGFRHYKPVDSTALSPLENQQYQFDTDSAFSIGGGTDCIPFCGVGQIAVRSPLDAYITVWDHPKGQPGQIGGGGVYHLTFTDPLTIGCPECSPIGELIPLAPTKGLAGNLPTSTAYGPDGKVYVGFLKSPSYVRVTNVDLDNSLQTVESVGTAPSGKSIFGLQFVGSDLYMVTGDGFYVTPNVIACSGNTKGCGLPKLIMGCNGACSAITGDGKGNIYFAANNGGIVYKYTPANGGQPIEIASGFAFIGAHTNGLGFDQDGNLWVGDNPAAEGINFGGRLSRILATDLP